MQFAVDPQDGAEFAVKFFLQEKAFRREAALYAACFPALRRHLSPSLLSSLFASASEPPPHDNQARGKQRELTTASEANMSPSCSTASTSGDGSNEIIEWGDAQGECVRLKPSRAVTSQLTRQNMGEISEPGPSPEPFGKDRTGTQSPAFKAGMHIATEEQSWALPGSFQMMPDAAAKFLPQVEAVCDDAVDPRGQPLPPCIVMEKGESLQDWSNRAEPDLFASLAVCPSPDESIPAIE